MKIRSIHILSAFALLLFLMMPFSASAASSEGETGQRPVQAFDVVAGKVVKTVPNSPEYQGYAKSWLKTTTGLSPKLQPEDKCGYVFRIPLDEPTAVKAGAEQVTTQDVFLFYCPKKPQLLLIFDENRKPYLLTFKANIKPFLKALDL
ncbi:hypothetical protein [Paenibacillus sacheonensis]|uniref:Uncharacterized protein n=1 Tax=Paenibacillus sacheonensis TaxID=742054 RepID=A0A7X4YRH6_9BACL|nr:hypothetical protein [Paenibacillus sacheonensis]MBM7563485.1 hypothetical protein [Paenibacillus sacheonensis]NBC71217.1 hypothetical protein [Paenibacillus sacheonensis]